MKILLVNPPRSPHNAILDNAPDEAKPFIHRKLVGPPLGLLTIAAAVKDHDISLLELKGEYDLHPEAAAPARLVEEEIRRFAPDVVGVTFIASEFNAGLEIFRVAKRCDPRIVTVAGGLHATVQPRDFARAEVDLVCVGPAAKTFRELVRALEAKTEVRAIPGLGVNGPDGLRFAAAPRAFDVAEVDDVLPDRALLKRWISTYHVGRSPAPATYLHTSLGCPYACTFCSIHSQYRGGFHQRDVESVIAELRQLDEYPTVRFADANTLVDAAWCERLFDRIAQEGLRKFFVADMRADAIAQHPRLIEKMAKHGLRVVISGFESFRDEELRRYGKASPARRIAEAIAIAHANGIMIRGNYVVPPDYGPADFDALADYAASNRVAFAGYTILTPMPGTAFFEEVRERIVDRDLDKYNFFNCVLPTKLPLEEFHRRVGALWTIKKGTEVI